MKLCIRMENVYMEVSKSDWKLFRSSIAEWQENYMERLVKEYIDLLKGEGNASDKFWNLEERIKRDRKNPGVLIELRKSNMIYDIVSLINMGVISKDDLEGFSDDLKEKMDFIINKEW